MFALVGVLIGICAACLWPTDAEKVDMPGISIDPQAMLDSTGLAAGGDNFTWQNHPNLNQGTATELRTGVNSKARAFARWTQTTIDSVVGTGTLVSARLDITLNSSSGWSGSGGQLSIHRVTKDWTELGSTANCAIDTNTGNDAADCSGATAWVLNNPSVAPWKAAATDSIPVTNGQTGKISFNVTADVQAFLDDTSNFGWVIKPRNDASNADIRLRSREATSNRPMLVITVDADTGRPPIPDGFPSPDLAVALLVSPPGQPDVLVLRDFIHIEFDDTTSGAGVRAVFDKYNAEVVGGYPLAGTYIVRIPDPGPTYAALDSVLNAIEAEPGVAAAYRRVKQAPGEELSRYPSDGPGGQRQDWFGSGTDATRALKAIRAPFAWGCETGMYTTPASLVGVGIIDNIFDVSHPDLASSTTTPHPVVGEILDTAVVPPEALSHGTGVAGVIAAKGDNDTATAGLVWGANLHLFDLARTVGGVTRRVEDRGSYIANIVLVAARTAQIRILHSSITAGADPRLARRIAFRIESFVNAGPSGRLFVQAAGNDLVTIAPSVADTMTGPGVLMQQAIVSMRGTPAANRVLLVAAANANGTARWTDPQNPLRGATLWTGVTDILAPGEDVLMLARPVDFPAGTVTQDGSSLAAPMVSGVAAQLLAFDSTLTADQVRSYILNGAKERMTPFGTLIPVPAIPNSGGLNLLDAYGALARVAMERPNTPVCGFPVYTRDGELLYERVPGTPVARSVSGTPFLWDVTVAQGGRILSAASTAGWLTFDHLGQNPTALPPDVAGRVYLERDTADLLPDSSRIRIGRADGSADTVDVKAAIAPTASVFTVEDFAASPTGEWIAVASRQQFAGPLNPLVWEWSIVPVGAPGPTSVSRFVTDEGGMPCGPDCDLTFRSPGAFGWSQDGERLQFALPRGTATLNGITVERSVMRSVTFAGGTPAGALTDIGSMPGRELVWPRFTADGELLLNERDVASGTCSRTWRIPETGQFLADSPTAAADCDRTQDPRRIFNAPPIADFQSLPPALRSALEGQRRVSRRQ